MRSTHCSTTTSRFILYLPGPRTCQSTKTVTNSTLAEEAKRRKRTSHLLQPEALSEWVPTSGILKGRTIIATAITLVRCTQEGSVLFKGLHVVTMTEEDRHRQTTPDHHNGVRTEIEAAVCHPPQMVTACLHHQQISHVGLIYHQVVVHRYLRL